MSSVKSLCKAAREALDRGDASTALKLCEAGLAIEPNYMLLVFKALSLQNLGNEEDSLASYRMASKLEPEQALAWQGMATLLEGGRRWQESVGPLQTLRRLFKSDNVKYLNFTKRLLKAYQEEAQYELCLPLLEWLRGSGPEEARQEYLAKEIEIREKLEEALISKEVETQRYRLGSEPLPILRENVRNKIYFESPLDGLYKEQLVFERNIEVAEKFIDRLARKIPKIKEKSTVDPVEFAREHSGKLIELSKEYSAESHLARIILLDMADSADIFALDDKEYAELKNSENIGEQEFEDIALKWPDSLHVALLCIKYFWNKRELAKTQKWIKNARILTSKLYSNYCISTPMIAKQLNRLEGLVFASDGRLEDAIPLLRAALEEGASKDEQVAEALVECYTGLKDYQNAIELYHKLLENKPKDAKLLSDLGWQYFLLQNYPQALNFLLQSQELYAATPDSTLLTRLGRVYWEENESNRIDKNICLSHFLSAAKADPTKYEAFLYLGYYYWSIEKDTLRAEKCFSKALSLNVDCIEAALELCLIWITGANRRPDLEGNLQKVIKVLEPFTAVYYRNSKMWTYLGMAFSRTGKWPQSTNAYQNALKADHPDELRCLLGLAEGYRRQGRYTAAKKSYKRILEIDANLKTAIIGLAAVDAEMKEFESSREILKSLTACEMVEIEMIRVSFHHVEELINMGCVNEAIENLCDLSNQCKGIILSKSNLKAKQFCWKLTSDICLLALTLSEACRFGELGVVVNALYQELVVGFKNHDIWKGIKETLPEIKPVVNELVWVSCLCQLNLIAEIDDSYVIADAWTDLGVALLKACSFENKKLLLIIKDCLEQAVENHPSSGDAWLVLGIVHLRSDEYGLAQHCFIKATKRGKASAWLGLAHLYSLLGDSELAKAALAIVQVGDDPAPAWFYEAYLGRYSERVGELLRQALESTKNVDHPLSMLWVSKGKREGSEEDRNQLENNLMRRISFNSSDNDAKKMLKMLEPTLKPHDPIIIEIVNELLKSETVDQAFIDEKLPILESMNNDDSLWLRSYLCKQDPTTAMEIQFTGSLFSPTRWADILTWYHITGLGAEWLRLRITPEVAERLPSKSVEPILEIWGDRIPEDVKKCLMRTKRFAADFHRGVRLLDGI